MSLTPGTRVGAYEILSLIGVGGMGEVYRARDPQLSRNIALKLLPDAFASDPERLARFGREAQVLAALNHPNIAQIYAIETSGATRALVMELVEGETLAERIAKGPLPIDEALAVAKQITEALEAAHEQGIIHRDLKPANIKLREDGAVKVLDFGLAKLTEPAVASAAQAGSLLTQSPTITSPAMMTGVGMLLGTAAYMSPEQAKGRPADKRSDIWAFGCVLYEMLTAKRAFEGEDVSDTLASVLRGEPDWSVLPIGLPPAVTTLLRRCVTKDRRHRIGDASTVRFLLDEPIGLGTAQSTFSIADTSSVRGSPGLRRSRVAIALGMFVTGAAVTAVGVWFLTRPTVEHRQPVRFAFMPPASQPLNLLTNPGDRPIAITPDGTQIVYRAGSFASSVAAQLVVRPLDQLEPRVLSSIPPPFRDPFTSFDGRWVGFSTDTEIRKVSISGGPATVVCRVNGIVHPATWGPDDTIIFASSLPGGAISLLRVPAAGGEPTVLSKPDQEHGEVAHTYPSWLPGGHAILFTIRHDAPSQPANSDIAVLDLRTGQHKIVVRGGSQAQYVDSGHLVYAATGTLSVIRFDLARLEAVGDPIALTEAIATGARGEASFAISPNGTLVYVPGDANGPQGGRLSLVWVDRQGREEPIDAPPRAYMYPRISPDGARVALDVRDQENDIWIWDLKQKTFDRLTVNPGADRAPVWTPDGKRILFSSQRAGVTGGGNIFWQSADATGTAERLTMSTNTQYPTSISPDGTRVVLREDDPKTGRDVRVLVLDGAWKTESLIQTAFNEENADISPDGNWIAYQSNESGLSQIYVRPFPKVDAARWPISPAGGSRPLWARNGRELFYLDGADMLTAVPIHTVPTFRAGTPVRLFSTRYAVPQNLRTYDASADGQRFLMIKERSSDQTGSGTNTGMIVVANWSEELKARLPTGK
jgi:serine/threonine-protein kinase